MGTDDETREVGAVERAVAVVQSGFEPFDGLLTFAARVEGTIQIHAPHAPGGTHLWTVRVRWRPLGSAREQVCRGEDATFGGACLLCRGLLAHGLASGNFER